MNRLVPQLDIQFDGDCAQAIGLDLPVVAINLASRPDRWETLSRRMASVGITKLIRAPAIVGAELPDHQIAALLSSSPSDIDSAPRSHLTLTRPAIGCFLSHLGVWRWVSESGLPRVLVFEDDAAPAPRFDPVAFRRVVSAIPDEAGMVMLGRIIMHGLADRPVGSELARIFYFNGNFAYLITPIAARIFLQRLLPAKAHLDHQISAVLMDQRQTLAAYYTEPHFFEPDWSLRSDIYIPMGDEASADSELAQILATHRQQLIAEGRTLVSESM